MTCVCMDPYSVRKMTDNLSAIYESIKAKFESDQRLYKPEDFIGREGVFIKNSYVLDHFQEMLLFLQNGVEQWKRVIEGKVP